LINLSNRAISAVNSLLLNGFFPFIVTTSPTVCIFKAAAKSVFLLLLYAVSALLLYPANSLLNAVTVELKLESCPFKSKVSRCLSLSISTGNVVSPGLLVNHV
jgi:hypothetical protein